jgi:hypothetical protein
LEVQKAPLRTKGTLQQRIGDGPHRVALPLDAYELAPVAVGSDQPNLKIVRIGA